MGSSTGRDFHCYGKTPSGTELQVPAAGNWLENSEMLRSKEWEQGMGSISCSGEILSPWIFTFSDPLLFPSLSSFNLIGASGQTD